METALCAPARRHLKQIADDVGFKDPTVMATAIPERANAAAKLIEISKGKVAGFIFVINLFDLGGSDTLKKLGYNIENLIEFPGH